MYHSQMCSKTLVCVIIFPARMVLSALELPAIENMATAGLGNKKIATTLGLPQSTTMRWLQRLRSESLDSCCCFFFFFFQALLQVKKHLTVPNKRRRLERVLEAKRPHSGTSHALRFDAFDISFQNLWPHSLAWRMFVFLSVSARTMYIHRLVSFKKENFLKPVHVFDNSRSNSLRCFLQHYIQ